MDLTARPRIAAIAAIAALLLVPLALASSVCPANDPNIGPYTRVEILPNGYKLVNKEITVKLVRVNRQEGTEKPMSGSGVKVYFYEGTRKTLVASGTTGGSGEYKYTPAKLGKYMIETGGKAITFETKMLYDQPTQLGAVCGNGVCETDKLETQANCPDDCTVCGDTKCEGLEDKENCPDDCVRCGDGVCDEGEYWPSGCSCAADCIKCGDKLCDTAHGETSATCTADCGEEKPPPGPGTDYLKEYWWVLAVIILAILLLEYKEDITWRLGEAVGKLKRRGGAGGKPGGKEKRKEPKEHKGKEAKGNAEEKRAKQKPEDLEVTGIIRELMDTGVSENRIRTKLKEFGVGENEADALMRKASKR